ncbi:MAG: chemotaxis response regulator protein-glutamate methylesterase [SAR324 cluster bacterium]|nr:chemotaxis response regulator protein-glutamate methylesterase [SAR324 cluster bacterium]
MIRVLVVDDSALMRSEIKKMLETDPAIHVIGTASDGQEAVDKAKALKPDVMTLDINMPVMDGLEALGHIMRECPVPVIMVSALTDEGAEETIQALSQGAFDFIHKPSGSISLDIDRETYHLLEKIHLAATEGKRQKFKFKPVYHESVQKVHHRVLPGKSDGSRIIGLGVSTGGPGTLYQILPQIPAELNLSILIVQHMPEKFTAKLAAHLNDVCPMTVKEAENMEIIERGTIYIAPGGRHMEISVRNELVRFINIRHGSQSDINCPSVNVLFQSLCDHLGKNWLGVILTGMGADGADGVVRLRKLGGHSVVEAEETCTVFGMPKRAIERGGAEFVLPSHKIASKLVELYHAHSF